MKIELELWHLITLMTTVVAAFWALAKVIATQAKVDIKQQFATMAESQRKQAEELKLHVDALRRLERELLEHKTEVARDRVHRDDFTRVIATFTLQVENLRLFIERSLISEGRNRD